MERAEHARRPAHVELHFVHVERGLDGDSTRVERDALPDEHDGRRIARAAPVLHDDELRRLVAAARTPEEPVHAELPDVFSVEDGHLEAMALAEVARLLSEVRGRA